MIKSVDTRAAEAVNNFWNSNNLPNPILSSSEGLENIPINFYREMFQLFLMGLFRSLFINFHVFLLDTVFTNPVDISSSVLEIS